MKKIISVILAVVLVVSLAFSVSADTISVRFEDLVYIAMGDVNVDTLLNADDLALMRKIILGKEQAIKSDCTDMNYDSSVDVLDLIRLKKKVAGIFPKSLFEAEALTLKNKILNYGDKLPTTVTGTVYHVSASGSTSANGTESKPYSYSQFLNGTFKAKSGDAVLFKRGDIFRGTFKIQTSNNGVYYGAYGTGDKPKIYQSAKNYANVTWKSEGGKKYSLSGFSADAGIMVFNDGENVGYKHDKYMEIENDYDFYFHNDTKTLYVILPKSPSAYDSIEIGENNHIINVRPNVSDVTIENLCLKYTGAHAISIDSNSTNVKVRYCEIGYIGGSYLSGTLRYGNGIQYWCGLKNGTVEYNWIYQIYDSGFTHQGGGEYLVDTLKFDSNLVEYCGMGSIEYWMGFGTNEAGEWVYKSRAQNVYYTNNILRYAGYCWGGQQRPDKVSSHILSDITCPNWFSNKFNISKNIFDMSSETLICIGGTWGVQPRMMGNTYAQFGGNRLGSFHSLSDIKFDENVDSVVVNGLGDTNAKIYRY